MLSFRLPRIAYKRHIRSRVTHHEEEVVLTMLSLSLTIWLLLQSRGVHQLISACVMSNIHNERQK